MAQKYEFIVSDTDATMRLDKFLSASMPEFSRSEIQRGQITVNAAPAKSSYRVRAGDVVAIEMLARETAVASKNISSDFKLDIL